MSALTVVPVVVVTLFAAGCAEMVEPMDDEEAPATSPIPIEDESADLNPDIIRVMDYNNQTLTTLIPTSKSDGVETGPASFEITLKTKSDNTFSDESQAIGYTGSTTPVLLLADNNTGAPAIIAMRTIFHSPCTSVGSSDTPEVENAHWANVYLPIRTHKRSIPIVRPRTSGAKSFSVFFYAKTNSDALKQIAEAKSLTCSPIMVVEQPGQEFG